MSERKLPPFTELGMVALGLIVIGGIYLSSHIPQHVSLGPAIALLIAAAAVMAVNFLLLARVPGFAWDRFFLVAKWALCGYVFIASMVEYAFLQNHLSGGPLVVLTLSLVVFALQVPGLIAFTVARFAVPASA